MTTIKATCPGCGEVGLMPGEIELRVDRSGGGASFYAFTCPSCLDVIRKPADDRAIRLLISGGVHILSLEATPAPEATPASKATPSLGATPWPKAHSLAERFDRPPITHDDLLDFHGLLERDDWFDDLVALTGTCS
ncbi:MAG: hypothetical protein ACRDYA_04030 [Egibacteraceae bacterium]